MFNDKSYQRKDAQCGMYAIHFIKEMLKGIPFQKFLTQIADRFREIEWLLTRPGNPQAQDGCRNRWRNGRCEVHLQSEPYFHETSFRIE